MLSINSTKKLLIVDDDDILQSFLCKSLANSCYAAECLLDDSVLPKVLERFCADLIVLDIELPYRDGLYWLTWLQQYYPNIPVILASVRNNEHERLLGLERGARDYVVKPFQFKELLIRIEHILGKHPASEFKRFIRIGELELDTQTCVLKNRGQEIKLTALETKILKLLYINNGAPVSRDDIAAQVKGADHNPLDRSIDIHINKLRKKIEPTPAMPTYICTVRGKGYRLNSPAMVT